MLADLFGEKGIHLYIGPADIGGALERIEAKMLTQEEFLAQLQDRMTSNDQIIANELSEVTSWAVTIRDEIGNLKRMLEEANARADFTDAATRIQQHFGEFESKISGMSDAVAQAAAPVPPPPVEPPPTEPEPPPVEPTEPTPVPVEPVPVEPTEPPPPESPLSRGRR